MNMCFEGSNEMLPVTDGNRFPHDMHLSLEINVDNCTNEEVRIVVYAWYDNLRAEYPEIAEEIRYLNLAAISVWTEKGIVLKRVLTIHFRNRESAAEARDRIEEMFR